MQKKTLEQDAPGREQVAPSSQANPAADGADPGILVAAVTGKDGWRGVIRSVAVRSGAQAFGQLTLDDGSQVWVPTRQLRPQTDGSYCLDVMRADLDRATALLRPGESLVVPVVAEELDISKQAVATETVRVHKTVREVDEDVDVPLSQERLEVKTVPVGRVVDRPTAPREEEDALIIPVFEEILVLEKKLLLREELHIVRKREQVRDTRRVRLRKEEVSVVHSGADTAHTGSRD